MAKVSRPKVTEEPVQVIKEADFNKMIETCDDSFLLFSCIEASHRHSW